MRSVSLRPTAARSRSKSETSPSIVTGATCSARGLSALDDIDEQTLGTRPSMAHRTARQEVEALLASLKLPIDERGRRRARARSLRRPIGSRH
jgi:hypothetical protein